MYRQARAQHHLLECCSEWRVGVSADENLCKLYELELAQEGNIPTSWSSPRCRMRPLLGPLFQVAVHPRAFHVRDYFSKVADTVRYPV